MVWMCWHQPVQSKVCPQEVGATLRGQRRSLNLFPCDWLYFVKLKAFLIRDIITVKNSSWHLLLHPASPCSIFHFNKISCRGHHRQHEWHSTSHRRSASGQNKWHFYPPRAHPNESNWDVNPALFWNLQRSIRGKWKSFDLSFTRT